MNREITSKIIGKLSQNDGFPDWWESEKTAIPFFDNKELMITFIDFVPSQDKTFIAEADQALTNFFKLNGQDRMSISELAHKNCIDYLDAVEYDEEHEPLRQIKDKNEIWKFIQPLEIYVARGNYQEGDIYVQVICHCAWEQEHGLQLVFKQGKTLTRISDLDGNLTDE